MTTLSCIRDQLFHDLKSRIVSTKRQSLMTIYLVLVGNCFIILSRAKRQSLMDYLSSYELY